MPTTIETRVRLHRTQQRFRESRALYRGFVGGRGAGKTWVGAYDLIRRAKPGRTYLIASPTYTILHDTTLPTFETIARQLHRWEGIKATPRPSATLSTGATVRFRSAEEPDKLRGPNLSGVWLDEASMMQREAFDICIASLREQGEQGWLSATFTPKGLTHWTYDLFGKRQPNTELFTARTRDNPFAPPGFHDQIAQQYSGLRAAQELDGRFVQLEGAEWPPEYFADSIWADRWPQQFQATALAIDPAMGRGEKAKGCWVSVVFAGLDSSGQVWVEAWMDQSWDATRLCNEVLDLTALRGPQAVAVETNGGQGFLATLMLQSAQLRNQHLPLWGIHNSTEKEARIRTLGPLLAQRRVRFRPTKSTQTLVGQLRDFPVGEFVDGPDALEMAVRMLTHLLGQGQGSGRPILLRT